MIAPATDARAARYAIGTGTESSYTPITALMNASGTNYPRILLFFALIATRNFTANRWIERMENNGRE